MYKLSDFFNDGSICIFTDASFYRYPNQPKDTAIGCSCAGCLVYQGTKCIDKKFTLLHSSTNNQGELAAIDLAVYEASRYPRNMRIRLFSDSQTSVFAIRDRIFKWVTQRRFEEDTKEPIANQSQILGIVYSIISNGIPIEIYHIKGHMNPLKGDDLKRAEEVFRTSNDLYFGAMDQNLVRATITGNCGIDEYTRIKLHAHLEDPSFGNPGAKPAITYVYNPFDTMEYYDLVHPSSK